MKTYRIHWIRHGMTKGTIQGRDIGVTDVPIAPEGIDRLNALRQRTHYPKATAYFTSPLRRCTQTLQILYPECSPLVVDDLRE